MRKHLTLFVAILFSWMAAQSQTPCENGFAGQYPCHLVDLLSFIPLNELNAGNNMNDVWGWTDPDTGREFALGGMADGTCFVEITDPLNPVFLGWLPTHTASSLWRDVKVYSHFAFIVSEAGGHGMQVFDLNQLLSVNNPPVEFDENVHYPGFGNAHNIAINEETGYAYAIGSNTFSGGLHIVNIQDPHNPVIAGGFAEDGYTHDCQAVIYDGPDADYQGREIVFASNEDAVTIVDVEDKTDCQLISASPYNNSAYTHQCWLTPDHRYLLVGDELDEMFDDHNTRTYVWDCLDLDEPVLLGYFESSSPAIDHNLYTLGNFVFQSNYRAGLRILDAVDVENNNLYEIGFFDMSPSNDNPEFSGSWSNYPYFPSGTVVATNMYAGLFMLRPTLISVQDFASIPCGSEAVQLAINIPASLIGSFTFDVEGLPDQVSISGSLASAPGSTIASLQGLSSLEAGTYDYTVLIVSEYGEYRLPSTLEITPSSPGEPLLSIIEGAQISDGMITWAEGLGAGSYYVQIAVDEDFSNVVFEGEVEVASLDTDGLLEAGTVYWVRVKSLNSCGESAWDGPVSFTILLVSAMEAGAETLRIYPVPMGDELNAEGDFSDVEVVRLYDAAGALLREWRAGTNRLVMDVSDLSRGTYTLQAGNIRYKLIK